MTNQNKNKRFRITVDSGGTFTDFVCFDEQTQKVLTTKVPSTPSDPSQAIIEGVRKLEQLGVIINEIDFFSHGTTVGTNALLEQKGDPVGLIVTQGMRGIAEVGEQARDYGTRIFDIYYNKPTPLALPRNTYEVDERVDSSGTILKTVQPEQAEQIAIKMKEKGISTVAVCLIFSFMNDENEQQIKKSFHAVYPECNISLSSELLPQIREYPRLSTTVINAYLNPIVSRYICRLDQETHAIGLHTRKKYVMQSNGGVSTFPLATQRSVSTILSGPAGGVVAGKLIGQQAGQKDLITFDMGGTSCDVSLLKDGEVSTSSKTKVEGRDVAVPMLDINTVSAGGGTIAYVNEQNVLVVGPESAGSVPGPVCYGKGGQQITVTDANTILGYLDSKNKLGGDIQIDYKSALKVMEETIAKPLGIPVMEAADGILKIVNVKMEEAIKAISSRKGYDLRDFTLIAFGGAGPVHAGQVALNLGIPRVISPLVPGVTSAVGLLIADVKHDYIKSRLTPLSTLDANEFKRIFDALCKQGEQDLKAEGFADADISIQYALDIRYQGQGYDLKVPLSEADIKQPNTQTIREKFNQLHERLYGHAANDGDAEIVNYRIESIGKLSPVKAISTDGEPQNTPATPSGRRNTYFAAAGGSVECNIYQRADLVFGNKIEGPAIIEQEDSTTVVFPEQHAVVDRFLQIIMTRKEG